MNLVTALGRGWRATCGYVRDLMGDTSYDRYLARHRIEHPNHEPLDRRTWWRLRLDEAEKSPQRGCC